MLLSPEVNDIMPHFELEEIRTICHLHGYPTGHWENLVDLPFRLSQDAGFRSDFTEIVRALQRSNLNLPDVLDILVISIGGTSAPQHSSELSEQLDLLGSFLAGVGRWPATENQPILAPGEIPANIDKFTRPQPLQSTVRLYEAPRRVAPRHDTPRHETPAFETQALGTPGQETRPPEPPVAASPEHVVSEQQSPEQEPPLADPAPTNQAEAAPAQTASIQPTPAAVPSSDDLSSDSNLHPLSEITRALARLERGNLELRAHLDSIDQRISRMEPLLESGATHPQRPDPSGSVAPLSPVLVSQEHTPRESFHSEGIHTRALHVEPTPAEPLRPQPIRTESIRSEPIHARSLRKPAPSPVAPIRSHYNGETRPADLPRPTPAPTGQEPVAPQQSFQPLPHSQPVPAPVLSPVLPRFSRFSRDPIETEPDTRATPPQGQTEFASEALPTRPAELPRGFFGTVPDPGPDDVALDSEPLGRSSSRFALIATVLILLGLLAAAAFLYKRSLATSDDPASGAADVAPAAAPQIPGNAAISSQGPLTATPSRSSSPGGNPGAKVLGARSAFQSRQSVEDLGSAGGFRPAATFVASSVMDGHLLSAPLPDQPRVPASSGLKGIVVMEANISNSGRVEDLHVLGGSTALRFAAIDAVRNWKYRPYTVNGNPIEVRTIIRVDFNEHRSQPAQRSAPFPS